MYGARLTRRVPSNASCVNHVSGILCNLFLATHILIINVLFIVRASSSQLYSGSLQQMHAELTLLGRGGVSWGYGGGGLRSFVAVVAWQIQERGY